MANLKISDASDAMILLGTDKIPIARAGSPEAFSALMAEVRTYVLNAEDAAGSSGADGTPVVIQAGAGDGAGLGGNLLIQSGDGSKSGSIDVVSGNGTDETGYAYIYSANATGSAISGEAGVGTGDTESGTSGTAYLYTGQATAGDSGPALVQSGQALNGNSGDVTIRTGLASGADHRSGDMILEVGSAISGAVPGNLKLINIATVDPAIADTFWLESGTLRKSGTTGATALADLDLSGLPVTDPGGGKPWLKAGDLHVGA